jgi:hypothetical protein
MLQDIITPSMPRSALRHRPVTPQTQAMPVQTPRASRAKQQREPHTLAGLPSGTQVASSTRRRSSNVWNRSTAYLLLGMLCACLLLWIGQSLWAWGSTTIDDIRYGRPRTTQVDQFVGHETNKTPSHFVAMNLHGQIYVLEIPGGSPNTSHLLLGPHLFGPGADLAPVTLSFPGDPHHPDLLITVDGVQARFHNTGSSFVPTT